MNGRTEERKQVRLDRQSRREQIVDAAASVFKGRDATEVTFEEIAEAAGVSRALVYNYFGDRHGLMAAVYLRNRRALQAQVEAGLTEGSGLEAAVRNAVRVHLAQAEADPDGYRQTTGQGLAGSHPELLDERVASIAQSLGGGPGAVLVARGFLATLQATALGFAESEDRSVDLDTAVEVVSALLWSGLAGLASQGVVKADSPSSNPSNPSNPVAATR